MTEISFHTQVPEVLDYACRLVRKAWRRGARLAVTGEPELLRQLDRALWVFEPTEFVPHLRLAAGEAVPANMADTPIWLVDQGTDAPAHEVLVNLGAAPAAGFESFARLIEIVGSQADEAQSGRLRWRHYTERGYRIDHRPYGAAA